MTGAPVSRSDSMSKIVKLDEELHRVGYDSTVARDPMPAPNAQTREISQIRRLAARRSRVFSHNQAQPRVALGCASQLNGAENQLFSGHYGRAVDHFFFPISSLRKRSIASLEPNFSNSRRGRISHSLSPF